MSESRSLLFALVFTMFKEHVDFLVTVLLFYYCLVLTGWRNSNRYTTTPFLFENLEVISKRSHHWNIVGSWARSHATI